MNPVGLIVVRPGFPDRRVPLQAGVSRLGRAEDNEICLPDIGVSRRHARIVVDGVGVVFEDLGSGNGSWLEGQRISSTAIRHGDEVSIDPFLLRFEVGEPESTGTNTAPSPAAPPALTEGPPPAVLEVITSVHGMRPNYPLTEAGLTMGRSEQRDIVIPDLSASRLHCEIVSIAGDFIAKDTGAANGLFVNEQRIREKRLIDGDVIRIGSTELRFMTMDGGRSTDILPPDEPEHTEAFGGILDAPTRAHSGVPSFPAAPPPPPGNGAWPAQPTQVPHNQPAPAPGGFGAPAPQPGFGAPAQQPGFGAPAQQPGFGQPGPGGPGFGGAELGGGPAPRPSKPLVTPIRLAIGVILCLVAAMFVGKVVLDFAATPRTAKVVKSEGGYEHRTTDLDDADLAEIDGLMQEGIGLFMDEEYYAATSRFLQILKMDPGHEDAERMGYVACEFIAIQAMQDVVEQAAASEADKKVARQEALAMGKAALDGKANLGDARDAVRQALRLNPDDEDLAALSKQLQRRSGVVARAATDRQHARLAESIGPMYEDAKAALDRGDWSSALSGFEGVKSADPGRSTPYYYQAEEGISDVKSRMRRAAAEPYKHAMASMSRGDNLTARSKLKETLRLDPYHAAAKQKLSEVQARLESEASDKYKEARVLESANQVERALSLYSQVQKLVGDKNHELHKLAQQRIDALLR